MLLEDIHESPVSFRAVNRASPDYEYLALSVKDRGVLVPILVRPSEHGYEIIKGCHRYQAAKDAGHTEIPARVIEATDSEVVEIQVITSTHRIEAKPIEYSTALLYLSAYSRTITLIEMAKKLDKSPRWVRERLGLDKLHAQAATRVNIGRINLTNAYVLAKLPEAEQLESLDKAQVLNYEEFAGYVLNKIKEIRNAKRAQYRGVSDSKECVAHVSREFFEDGKSDGTETEFIYSDNPIAESLKGCRTIEEVRAVLKEPPKIGYYWVVAQVQFVDRVLCS